MRSSFFSRKTNSLLPCAPPGPGAQATQTQCKKPKNSPAFSPAQPALHLRPNEFGRRYGSRLQALTKQLIDVIGLFHIYFFSAAATGSRRAIFLVFSLKFEVWSLKLYTILISCTTSNFKLQTSNFKLQTSNFKLKKLQTSNFTLCISSTCSHNQRRALVSCEREVLSCMPSWSATSACEYPSIATMLNTTR